MPTPLARSVALVAALAVPSVAAAEGLAINHNDVACIVAGEYSRLTACFSPAADVARARIYFRPETLTSWYYVEMGAERVERASDAACHAGILPKATSKLIDKRVFYYVEAFDRRSAPGQTSEFAPIVVRSAEECKKKGGAAPLSQAGPAAVFPVIPPGFGLGTGVSAAVVGGGVAAAAAVTVGALALREDDDAPTITTPDTIVGRPPDTTPVTQPPVTVPPVPGQLVVACTATPRNGDAPLRVVFQAFATGGTGDYAFSWNFEDGGSSLNPSPSHTFLSPGVYNATVLVTSGTLTAACSRSITVTSPPTPPPSPSPSPSASPSPSPSPSPSASPSPTIFILTVDVAGSGTGTITGTGINCPGDCTEPFPSGTVVTLTATPAGTPPTVFKQWTGDCTGTTNPCVLTMTANKNAVAHFELIRTLTVQGGANSDISGSVTSNPPGITCTWAPTSPCTDTAVYINGSVVTLTVATAGATSGAARARARAETSARC
jgi:PKD repeat protein